MSAADHLGVSQSTSPCDGGVSWTTGALAEHLDGTVHGDAGLTIKGVQALDAARSGDLSFIAHRRYLDAWRDSAATAALVSRRVRFEAPTDGRALIAVDDAELAVAAVLELFRPADTGLASGIDASAIVDPTARIGDDVRIGAGVSIGPNCVIGDGVTLYPGVRLYEQVEVGSGSTLHANVVVRERCRIGQEVILHANVTIGTEGFGYRPAPDGSGLVPMPHIGTVEIDDRVEIGAGSCVDRGKFGATRIGMGTKIDNQVQVAHNVEIGRHCVIAGQAGLAGSVRVGDGVQIGGAARFREHLRIGDGARVAGAAVVGEDVPPGAVYTGYPAMPHRAMLRQWALLRKLPALIAAIRETPMDGDSSGAEADTG